MTPTARSLAQLRKDGWTAQVVEKWNPHSRTRLDLFGVIDIVAVRAESSKILGVQATSGSNASARVVKSLAERRLALWLMAGGAFEVWSWAKQGPRGKRKLWTLRRQAIRVEINWHDEPQLVVEAA